MTTHEIASPVDELVGLFPEGSFVDSDGELVIAGVRATELAETFGTPAYIVDEDALRRQVRRFPDALSAGWPNSKVYFASKAFPCTAAYRLMTEEGIGADIAGGGELAVALSAGVNPEDIVMHGNAKTIEELYMAVEAGVGLIVVDNFDDINRLERIVHGEQRVLVRVIPGVNPGTHDSVATGQHGSKFGLPAADARAAISRLRNSDKLKLDGVHMHIGSQILDTAPFTQAVQALAEFGEFEVYDLGGGLGVPYTNADRPPTPEQWVGTLVDAARRYLPGSARLFIEPGRSMVAQSGVTLYRVVSVKRGTPTFVAVDGGMGDNLEVALYQQRFEATIANRVGGGSEVDLVGRHCESGDRLATGVALREATVGDVVAVPVTGAYCYTMANNYNGARRPPVVFCRAGLPRVVVRRENYDDLLRRDLPDL
jgi:diaminopimelate decarboxylase